MFGKIRNIIKSISSSEKSKQLEEIQTAKKYRTGLALSGGGARGISHLGSVKALLEYGYTFDIISGTSIGAIIGCVLADGYHPDEIASMLTMPRLKSFYKTDISRNNLMNLDGMKQFLTEILRTKNIEDLPIPFIATATNLNKGEARYFTKGDIVEAVIASSSIPIIFPPVVIDGEQYVDGGIINNLPVRPIRKDCEKIIGFQVNPSTLGLQDGHVKGFLQIATRTFHLAMYSNVLPDKNLCNIYIEHENLEAYGVFSVDKMMDIFNIGYTKTKEVLDNLSYKNKAK